MGEGTLLWGHVPTRCNVPPHDGIACLFAYFAAPAVAIPAAAYLEPVPVCTRRFETRYVQIQCNTGTYSQTFIPSAIRLWNTLPVDIYLPAISWQFQDPSQQFPFRLSTGLRPVFIVCTALFLSQVTVYCSWFAARLSRYTSAYSLVVRYCSESSRHRYCKMKIIFFARFARGRQRHNAFDNVMRLLMTCGQYGQICS